MQESRMNEPTRPAAFTRRHAVGAIALAAAAPSLALAQAKDPLRIGVATAMSGPYAVLLNEVRGSIEFAVAEAMARGGIDGRKIEVRFLDSEVKPDVARRQAEKLALEGFNVLIGTISSGEILAIAPMLERWDALMVSTFAKSTRITGDACSPRLFKANQGDHQDIAVLKPWLATRSEKKWAILGADIAWGREIGKNFKEALAAGGLQLLSENYSAFGSADFAPFIQQIKAAGVEAAFVALSGRDSINFLTQAKQFGLLDQVVVGGISINLDSNIRAVGAAAKGIWGNMNYSPSIDTPQNRRFVEAWRKAHNGEDPSDLEGENYAGIQTILQAVERAKSVKPADLAKVMRGGTFDTVFGNVVYRAEDNQLVLPNYFGQVREREGKLRNTVVLTVPAEKANPPADGSCKLPKA
jgi:branched-chain amino acid transport system substrate-binding protein